MSDVNPTDWRKAAAALSSRVDQNLIIVRNIAAASAGMYAPDRSHLLRELDAARQGAKTLLSLLQTALAATEREAERYHELRERLEEEQGK